VLEQLMEKTHQIVEVSTDSTRIYIVAIAEEDGSIRIDDW
jgi:hypothetical protein